MRWTKLHKNEKERLQVEHYCRWRKWFAWHPVTLYSDGIQVRRAWLEFVGRKGRVVDRYGDWGASGWKLGGWKYCAIEDILQEALIDNDMITESESGYKPAYLGDSPARTSPARGGYAPLPPKLSPIAPPPPPPPIRHINEDA